jgi:hypothetical protein
LGAARTILAAGRGLRDGRRLSKVPVPGGGFAEPPANMHKIDKGKPAARRGRKAAGLSPQEAAGPPDLPEGGNAFTEP